MAKKRATKNPPPPPNTPAPTGSGRTVSLREESTGKLQSSGGARNSKSFLKLEHLQNLAVWASQEASIPSLATFFGTQAAAAREALGASPDPSIFHCQRCETILHPGFNCTVRIEKTRARTRHRNKKLTQNNVIYKCQFCSHQNQKRGTPKGHMKEICPSKVKPSDKAEPSKFMLQKFSGLYDVILPATSGDTLMIDSPATPMQRSGTTLLDAKKRKRNGSASKKPEQSESNSAPIDAERAGSASSKRKRKSWTSLKEIAESDSSRNITNLKIPLIL